MHLTGTTKFQRFSGVIWAVRLGRAAKRAGDQQGPSRVPKLRAPRPRGHVSRPAERANGPVPHPTGSEDLVKAAALGRAAQAAGAGRQRPRRGHPYVSQ